MNAAITPSHSDTPITSTRRGTGITKALWDLTKPRIVMMVLITSAVGYILGARGAINIVDFIVLLVLSGLSCAGVGVLNQYAEREEDKLMKRTSSRPLPLELISPQFALTYGLLLAISGSAGLWLYFNPLCGLLSVATVSLYLLVYTPLKKLSWTNTIVGAVPGAIPPLGGWVAATDTIEIGGILLFLILFFWQHPHFYSIAWMYQDDYARGGFKMLPHSDPTGAKMYFQVVFFLALLSITSLLPYLFADASIVYIVATVALGFMFWRAGLRFLADKNRSTAVKLLRASIIYLPSLLILMVTQVRF